MRDLKPKNQKDLLLLFRERPFRMATTLRELFELLEFLNAAGGWEQFIRSIDFAEVTPGQICQVVFGRSADSPEKALAHSHYDPAAYFRSALLSPEFRKNIQRNFLRAYPEKGRDVFIHIPKCAGTDLILNLGARSVPLSKTLELDGWLSPDEFLEVAGGLARAARDNDRLFAYGHMELGEYVERAGIRPIDRIFTVLRDPIDLMVSQANYVVGRLRQDPNGKEPDTAHYMKLLGVKAITSDAGANELKNLTARALTDAHITEPNRACFYLGRDSRMRYDIAMHNIIVHNVELTTTEHYGDWLAERWGLDKGTRHNASEPIIAREEAIRIAGDMLVAQSAEDRKLYDVISYALATSGRSSVKGLDLPELVGPGLLEAAARNEIPLLENVSRRESQRTLVAMGPAQVAFRMAPISINLPSIPRVETVLSIDFGADGHGKPYRVAGWANAEPKFTWTSGQQAIISLPALEGDGDFIFRLVTSAFIVKSKLPEQRVEIFAEGRRVGECKVRDLSVLECELPRDLIGTGQPIAVALHTPDAACPREVTGAEDDRMLALAVRSVAVLCVRRPLRE